MSIGCPVGHPSGPGRHCPLCGRDYVPIEAVVVLPAPRYEVEQPVAPWVGDNSPRLEVEAFALLSSLASDSD